MPEKSDRTTTGVFGLDASLMGGYPKGKIILEGPASDERHALALSFVAEGLRNDEYVMIVTSTISPTKVRMVLRKLDIDVKVYERKGRLIIVDWYSHNASLVAEIEEIGAVIKCPGDTLNLNEAFHKAFSKFPKGSKHRAVIEGLSAVVGKHNVDTALLLANSLNSTFGDPDSTILFVVDSEMHDSTTISSLEEGFDGRIEFKRIKGKGAVIGELSIHSMDNTEIPTDTLLLEKGEDGKLRIEGSGAYVPETPTDEGITELIDSLQEDASNETTWFGLGSHYAAEKDYDKAHECFDAALKIRPGYVASWIAKANLCIEQGRNDEALRCYRHALNPASEKKSGEAEFEKIEDVERDQEKGECPECGGIVSVSDPFCLNCGSDLPEEGVKPKSIEKVLEKCDQRIQKDPDDVDAWFVKGLCLARLGRFEEAIVALNETTRLNFEYPGLWIVKGKVYSKIGDEKMATLSIQRGIEFARMDTGHVGPTFECSICGKDVNVEENQCPNCGAKFTSLAAEVKEDVEVEERPRDLDGDLESILSKWESELTEMITPPEKKEIEPERSVAKRGVVRRKTGLTNGLVGDERKARLSRRAGVADGMGRTNGLTNGIRGRTNGLTNGLRGRTNGLTNGVRGRTNGLTNGVRGRTNGLTNGVRGRTNGLTNGVRGRTNGLTNGVRGRTNGLTNGVRGRTNGLTNGVRGRTNGLTNGLRTDVDEPATGWVNGLGREMGVTNGLSNDIPALRISLADGLTNGNGLTNGLGVGRFSREIMLAKWKIYLVPLVAFLLLLVPLFYVAAPMSKEPVSIDGNFDDWQKVQITSMDTSGLDSNTDIINAAVEMSERSIYLYLEVMGNLLQGNRQMGQGDAIHILIDVDRNSETGYEVKGLGADNYVEITGIDGAVQSSKLWEFPTMANTNDWNAWQSVANLPVAVSSGEIEIRVNKGLLGTREDSVLVLFHTLSWNGDEDFAEYLLSETGGVLSVIQRSAILTETISGTGQNLLDVELTAINDRVSMTSLDIEVLGTFLTSEIGAIELVDSTNQVLDQTLFQGSPIEFEFEPLDIEEGDSALLTVRADFTGGSGKTIGMRIPSSYALGIGDDAATSVYSSSTYDFGYLESVPQQITVDGGFADWTNCTNIDETHEASTRGDSDIDIICFDSSLSQNSLFAYFDVGGRVLAGTSVPRRSPIVKQESPPSSLDSDRDTVPDDFDENALDFNNDGTPDSQTPQDVDGDSSIDYPFGTDYWLNTTIPDTYQPPYAGRNVTKYIGPVEKPPVYGDDVARMFIDSDNLTSTGYSIASIGADYLIELRGLNGRLRQSALYEFGGGFPGNWNWNIISSDVDVAFDSRRLEASLDVSSLQVQSDYVLVYEVENWRGGFDRADSQGAGGTRANLDFLNYLTKLDTNSHSDVSLEEGVGIRPIVGDEHYAYASANSLLNAYFASGSGEADQVRIEKDGHQLTWQMTSVGLSNPDGYMSLYEVAQSPANSDGIQVEYLHIAPGMREIYRMERDVVKHDVLIESRSAIDSLIGDADYLSFEGVLTISDALEVWTLGRRIGSEFSTDSTIRIVDEFGAGFWVSPPFAYEKNNPSQTVYGRFHGVVRDSRIHLFMDVPIHWLRSKDRQYPVVVDPTVTVEEVGSDESTKYSNQRKIFHDGEYYWAFYFNVSASGTVYEYSQDGYTWSGTPVKLFATNNMDEVSVWFYDSGSQKIVYAVSGSPNSHYVQAKRGTITGTTITWGSDYDVQVSELNKNQPGKVAFITRSSDGYVWIISGTKETTSGAKFNLAAVRSTNTDDLSAWDARSVLWASNIDNFYIYPIILPLSGGDMYALWYADGEIAGTKYISGSGWSGTIDYIENTTASVSTKPPSAVVDSSGNIHLVYSNGSGAINYTKYTTSWGTPTVLDSSADNVHPTISLQSTNDYLYVFWVNSSYQVWGSKWTGSSWSNLTRMDVNTDAKNHLTSIYSAPSGGNICWECGAGISPNFSVKALCIPEFDSVLLPALILIAIPISLSLKGKRKRK